MTQKLAVIVIHGLGKQHEDFASAFIKDLHKTFFRISGEKNPEARMVIKPVWWASVFAEREEELKQKLVGAPYNLRYTELREFMIHYLADAVAYQPLESGDQNYEAVHRTISKQLNRLSTEAGADAPLCVISHSLGSVIASNFFYDLQYARRKPEIVNPDSALERGTPCRCSIPADLPCPCGACVTPRLTSRSKCLARTSPPNIPISRANGSTFMIKTMFWAIR